MVTEKSLGVGGSLVRFLGRLLVVWMASLLLCDAALAQPKPTDKKKPKAEAGALDQIDAPAAKKPDEPAEPVEVDEPAPEPEKKYDELPVDETLRKSANTISGILMAGKFDGDAQKNTFDEFYRNYFLPRWTQAKNIGSLPALRKEMRISHLGRRSSNTMAHDHLNGLVLDFMKKLATGPYHPTVQLNAMYLIGELNSVEQPAPVPLPEALEVLIGAVESAKLPDAIRVAAMVGIQRHVSLGGQSAEVRKTLNANLLKLATGELPEGLAAPGREWILGQAIETLGMLGSVSEDGVVAKQMIKTVANPNLSFSTRTIAAESLGNLIYAGDTGISPVEATAVLGQFAIDACTEELRLAREHNQPPSRRRLKQRLGAVLKALSGSGEENRKGIASLAKEDAPKAFLGELQKEIGALVKFFDDPQHEGDDLEEPVNDFKDKLEKWSQRKPK